MGSGFRRKGLLLLLSSRNFLARRSRGKKYPRPPAPAGFARLRATIFKNRLSAEVADIFISLARNKNSAMTVIVSRPLQRRGEHFKKIKK